MSDSTLLSGVGYVRDTIPHDIFAQLTAEASLAREKAINVNRELAGAIKEEYNIGTKTITDLIDAESELLSVNVSLHTSKKNMILNYFNIMALQGTLISSFEKYLPNYN